MVSTCGSHVDAEIRLCAQGKRWFRLDLRGGGRSVKYQPWPCTPSCVFSERNLLRNRFIASLLRFLRNNLIQAFSVQKQLKIP